MPILMLKSSKLLFLLRTAAQNILSPISHGKHSITYLCLPQTRIVDLTSPSWTSDKLSLDLLIFVSQTCFLSFESSKVFVFASFLTAARRNNALFNLFHVYHCIYMTQEVSIVQMQCKTQKVGFWLCYAVWWILRSLFTNSSLPMWHIIKIIADNKNYVIFFLSTGNSL